MKKLTAVLLILCILFAFTACADKTKSLKEIFEENGYSVTTVSTDNALVSAALQAAGLTQQQMEEADKYEIWFCIKGILSSAVIIKFPDGATLREFFVKKDVLGTENTEFYDSIVSKGWVNDNFVIFGGSDAVALFKQA